MKLQDGNVFTGVCLSMAGVLPTYAILGLYSPQPQKMGGTHPTRMLFCLTWNLVAGYH